MKKKLLIGIIMVLVLAGIGGYYLLTRETKEEKVYRVGILSALRFFDPVVDGFKEKMTELGYIEGKNIVYDIHYGPAPVGNEDIVKKFVDDKVDLILAYPTEATLEAEAGTEGTGIPIVSCGAYMEVIVKESLRYPGGDVTGVRYTGPENAVERLEILHEIAPQVKRVWIPFLKDYPTVAPQLEILPDAAASLGITLMPAPFTTPEEVKADLEAREASGDIWMDAILMLADPFSVTPPVNDIVDAFGDKHGIPVGSALVRKVHHELGLTGDDYGPIFGWTPNNFEIGMLAAPLADKIFRGTPAGTIPVVTPENELQINLKVTQKLGLTVGEDLLSRASLIVR